MRTVGLRELKNRLSECVREVRAGRTLLVTDRGHPVAEISPPRRPWADGGERSSVEDLVRRGLLTVGAGNDPRLYRLQPRRLRPGRLRRLLEDTRGDR